MLDPLHASPEPADDPTRRLLLDTAADLADGLDAARLVLRAGDALARLAPVDLYTCHVLAPHGAWAELVASRGLDAARFAGLHRIAPDALLGAPERLGVGTCFAQPLVDGERVVGLVCFGARARDAFDSWTTELVAAIAGLATAAVRRERAERAAAAAERRKEDFLATLAHELRNPLAPIRQAVRVARVRHGDGAQLEWSLGVIERQAGHLKRLLDELLDVSRLNRGRLELRRESVALRGIVDAALETAQPLIEQQRHRVGVDVPAGDVLLDADPLRLAEAVTNLLTNAARFTPPGGTIGVRARALPDGATVEIVVSDDGVGIAAERLEGVFDTFSHAEPALHRTAGGLGIGLAIARGLVELHGGTLRARSGGPGTGSEFVLRVPRAAAQAAATTGAAPAPPRPGDEVVRRVVIADDNRDAAHSLALLLEMSGYEVRTAHDGAEALQLAEGFRPAAAVLDIGMPRLNGYEVAARIRAEPWGRNVKLLALTGWGHEDDKRRASEVGFDHHLTKPVDPDRVEALLVQTR